MPKRLREWRAYEDLRAKLTDFQDLLPLISELAKPSVKPRHWKELFEHDCPITSGSQTDHSRLIGEAAQVVSL